MSERPSPRWGTCDWRRGWIGGGVEVGVVTEVGVAAEEDVSLLR